MTDNARIRIGTHTPEQTLQWKEIASSNADRVVRTLLLGPEETTKEGDKQKDIHPVLQALKEILLEGRNGGENRAWTNLVAAGIADALCKNVCELVPPRVLPIMPTHLMETAKNERESPYHAPLEVLCTAAVDFQYPPTKTDKKVIAALRKNWSEMMERIWNEPDGALRPEDSHTLERMVVAQLVLRIIITDPTFIDILFRPSDLTIQIIARHWRYARRPPDTSLTASTLYVLLDPNHPRQIAYVRSNGLESEAAQIVSKILVGVGPTALSSKQQQVKALLATFAEHLGRSTAGRDGVDQLVFLMGIIAAAKKDATEPELTKAVLKATPLWNAMFRLLKKSAKPATASADSRAESVDPEVEKKYRLRIISDVVGTSANIFHDATFEYPRECEHLARIWANENLFGALEETIELLVTMPGMTMQLTRLAGIIDDTVAEGTPSLLRLYRTQFPRWRILGTLLRHDIKRQQDIGHPPFNIPGNVPPPDSNFWDHGAWQSFGGLQLRCTDNNVCSKRSCENNKTGDVVCICEVAQYCSETCQTKDAKEHRLACGLLGLLQSAKVEGSVRQAASPLPIQRTKKTKKPQTKDPVSGGSDTRLGDLD